MIVSSRAIAGALVVVLLAMLVACGSSTDDSSTTGTQSETATAHGDAGMATSTAGDSDHDGDGASSDDSQDSASTAHLHVTVSGGSVSGDTKARIARGSEVVLHVTSDVADTVHVHGYDIEFAVEPNVEKAITFEADIAGQWEIETHESNRVLTILTVK